MIWCSLAVLEFQMKCLNPICLTKTGPVVSIRTGRLNGSITVVIPVAGSGERADLGNLGCHHDLISAVTKV
jgi:uncharacterized protein YifN (PemK superfamily)